MDTSTTVQNQNPTPTTNALPSTSDTTTTLPSTSDTTTTLPSTSNMLFPDGYVEYVCNSITKLLFSIPFSYINLKEVFSVDALNYMAFCTSMKIPPYFVVTESFREVISNLNEPGEDYSCSIVGPKGVGKTLALVALAAYYNSVNSNVFDVSIVPITECCGMSFNSGNGLHSNPI